MIEISLDTALEIDNLLSGVFSPLTNFCDQEEYRCIIQTMRTPSGAIWPIPIIMPVDERIPIGEIVSLAYNGSPVTNMIVSTCFELEPEKEALLVYGTTTDKHPKVKKIINRQRYAISGKFYNFTRFFQTEYRKYQLDPIETKKIFKEKNWKKIVGFQTRNPIHRAHEYVIKSSLESVDGLFVNPLAGPQKDDDIPANIRLKTYKILIENYFNPDRIVLGIYPSPMYYAGPREAILHAIVRRNYGCTHFIVGRDHAGVGGFYGPYDAQNLAYSLEDSLGIEIIKFDKVFYDKKTHSMVSSKTMPIDCEPFEISGTRLRNLLEKNEEVPEGISRPEVLAILREYYGDQQKIVS